MGHPGALALQATAVLLMAAGLAWGQTEGARDTAERAEGVAPDPRAIEEARVRTQIAPRPKKAAEPPAQGWSIDPGGQVRLRGDFARNQSLTDLAFAPGRKESQFLQRTRPQVSISNGAAGLTCFVQGQWYGRWGADDDRSDADLSQAYIEWRDVLGLPLDLKAGRQELSYGSAFFLGSNDFYNGLAWDGLKATFRPRSDLSIDLIASRMAEFNPGDPQILMAGIYASYAPSEDTSLETYLFHNDGGYPLFHREIEKHDDGQKWFTVGVRLAGKKRGFDAELEPQFQWGRVDRVTGEGKDEIRAYGGHVDIGYTFAGAWQPRIFAAYALGSGHLDISDGRYGEFHGNIFNDNALVGDTGVIADLSGVTVGETRASGVHDGVAGLSVRPLERFDLNLDVHRFRAFDVPSGISSDLGVEVNLVASYQATDHLLLLAGVNRFFTGEFFKEAGGSGRDVDYVYLQTQIDFD